MYARSFGVVSMGRSGTHALMNWISGHFNRTFEIGIINGNLVPFSPTARRLTVSTYTRDFKNKTIKEYHGNLRPSKARRLFLSFKPEAIILSYMGLKLSEMFNSEEEKRTKSFYDFMQIDSRSNNPNILVIRSPWNNYASCLFSKFKNKNKSVKFFVDSWFMYAKEYMCKTNFVPNKVLFNYDEWFKNLEYRKKLSENLNLNFSDFGINTVGLEGFGSSFDGYEYQGFAHEMDVLNRWKRIQIMIGTTKYNRFRRAMSKRSIISYSKRIFRSQPPDF